MTWANRTAFFLILSTVIFTAVAYGAVHQPIIALFYVTTASLLILWAIDGFLSGAVKVNTSYLQLPIYAAAAYGAVQVIPFGRTAAGGVDGISRTISLDPSSTAYAAIHLLALAVFFSMSLAAIDSAGRIRRVVTVITVFGFIFAFFAILQGILSPTKIFGIYERQFATPYGTFVNRHNFAAYMEMALALPLAMVMAGGVRRDMRLLFLTAVSLMAVALVLSGSRGGLVALLAELIVLAIMTARTSGRRSFVLKLALAAFLVAAVVGGAIFVGGESSLTRIAETASSKDVTTSRTQIWATTLLVIAGNLPFGTGLGALGVAYTPVDKMSGLERVEQAHNDYLQVVSDAGIVGLIIGGVFLYLLVRTAVRNIRRQNDLRRSVAIGAAAGIFAILVHSIFDFVLHTTAVSVLFLVLVALLSATGRKYDDDIVTDDRDRRHRRKGSVHSIGTRRA